MARFAATLGSRKALAAHWHAAGDALPTGEVWLGRHAEHVRTRRAARRAGNPEKLIRIIRMCLAYIGTKNRCSFFEASAIEKVPGISV